MSSVAPPTSSIGQAVSFSQRALEDFLADRAEPAWLTARRREALAAFHASSWPTLRDEEWRRTDIRALKLASFAPPAADGPASSDGAWEAVAPLWDTLSGHYGSGIAHVDARLAKRSIAADLPSSVVFTTLAEAAVSHPEILDRYLLTQAVRPDEDVFSALHAAFWSSGVLLYVPKGVKVEQPLFHLLALSTEGRVDFNHTLVVLDEGAEATLVQESAGSGTTPGLHVGAVELFVGPEAKLTFVNIQNWDNQTWHLSRERAVVDRGGSVQWTVGGLGSRLAKVNQDVRLVGEGASAQVNGVMFTTGRQNLTYITRQDHAAPHTTSDLLYKGGLKDASRIVWRGMIRVEKEGQRTDAYQKNDSLVLSESARADSIPGLEIEANDVRCTHGATAGNVDENMVFYLLSRGIDRETAVRLIVEGFFANVYDRITLEPVQETLRQAVAAKLEL
jgi:Fe-S cluster assembly protein SufD